MYKKIKNSSFMNLIWFLFALLPIVLFIVFSINFSDYSSSEDNESSVNVSSYGSSYIGLSDYSYVSIDKIYGSSYLVDDTILNTKITDIVFSGTGQFDIIKSIPLDIQNLDGYGFGINNSVFNYIDFIDKNFIKNVNSVKAKDLSWYMVGNGFVANINDSKQNLHNALFTNYNANFDANSATGVVMYDALNDNEFCWYSNQTRIFVRDNNYIDLNTFIEHFTDNDYIYYELSMPIITDISQFLFDFNPTGLNFNYNQVSFVSDYNGSINFDITLFNDIHYTSYSDYLSNLLYSFESFGFIAKVLISLMGYFGVFGVYYNLLAYYLEYFIIINLIHLFVDFMLLLPNICHKFMERIGGERD